MCYKPHHFPVTCMSFHPHSFCWFRQSDAILLWAPYFSQSTNITLTKRRRAIALNHKQGTSSIAFCYDCCWHTIKVPRPNALSTAHVWHGYPQWEVGGSCTGLQTSIPVYIHMLSSTRYGYVIWCQKCNRAPYYIWLGPRITSAALNAITCM